MTAVQLPQLSDWEHLLDIPRDRPFLVVDEHHCQRLIQQALRHRESRFITAKLQGVGWVVIRGRARKRPAKNGNVNR